MNAEEAQLETDKPFSQKVEAMAGFGLSATDIATVLAMQESEVQALYGRELESGFIKANLRVAESLYRQALGDGKQSVTAAIFWLKTRARWKETSVHEVTGTRHDDWIARLTDEQLEEAIAKCDAQIALMKGSSPASE